MLSKEVNYYVMSIIKKILSEKYLNQEKKTIFHSFLHSLYTPLSQKHIILLKYSRK